jgi:hypothetical protein
MTTSPVTFDHQHRQNIKERAWEYFQKTGDKRLLADVIANDNWTEELQPLKEKLLELILEGIKELPASETDHGRFVSRMANYNRVLELMCWRRLSENAASVEVAAETRLPHQTVRTQIKSCKSDPFFDIDRECWAERRVEHDKLFPDDADPKKTDEFLSAVGRARNPDAK